MIHMNFHKLQLYILHPKQFNKLKCNTALKSKITLIYFIHLKQLFTLQRASHTLLFFVKLNRCMNTDLKKQNKLSYFSYRV